jgi:hypothetical protein
MDFGTLGLLVGLIGAIVISVVFITIGMIFCSEICRNNKA